MVELKPWRCCRGLIMPGCKTRAVVLVVFAVMSWLSAASAETWLLDETQDWKQISTDRKDQYLLAVAELKKLIDSGQAETAQKAFDKLKKDFPDIAKPDLDMFIKAEIYYCKGKFAKAAISYEKLLNKYPDTKFYEASLHREFTMAEAFLAGRKKTVLGVIKIKGHAEGVKIMERISDRAGLDEPNGIGLKAAVAVAEHYERSRQFNEAYLKWSEIASYWQTGQIGKEALLRMAQDKLAAYNKHPEQKRPRYDASKLTTARSYYEKFSLLYPQEAGQLGVPQTIKDIDEQLAYKELTIGRYYQKTGKQQAANLYFDMVVHNWPNSKAAEMAKQMLQSSLSSKKQ